MAMNSVLRFSLGPFGQRLVVVLRGGGGVCIVGPGADTFIFIYHPCYFSLFSGESWNGKCCKEDMPRRTRLLEEEAVCNVKSAIPTCKCYLFLHHTEAGLSTSSHNPGGNLYNLINCNLYSMINCNHTSQSHLEYGDKGKLQHRITNKILKNFNQMCLFVCLF